MKRDRLSYVDHRVYVFCYSVCNAFGKTNQTLDQFHKAA